MDASAGARGTIIWGLDAGGGGIEVRWEGHVRTRVDGSRVARGVRKLGGSGGTGWAVGQV